MCVCVCTFLATEAIISRVSLRGRPQVLRPRRRLEYLPEFLELGVGHVYRQRHKPPATFVCAETTRAERRISAFSISDDDVGQVRVSSGTRRAVHRANCYTRTSEAGRAADRPRAPGEY